MKILLIVTALFEGLVGVGLFLMPVLAVSTLLNTPLDTPGGLVAARLAGAAIIALAICCWQARDSQPTRAAIGIVAAIALLQHCCCRAARLCRSSAGPGKRFYLAGDRCSFNPWCVVCCLGLVIDP